jgi:hypothetical protein
MRDVSVFNEMFHCRPLFGCHPAVQRSPIAEPVSAHPFANGKVCKSVGVAFSPVDEFEDYQRQRSTVERSANPASGESGLGRCCRKSLRKGTVELEFETNESRQMDF